MGTIINIIKINPFISTNYLPAVEKLDNELNGRSSKLNENIFIAELTKINFFTSYDHIYLIIKIRFKLKILNTLRKRC
jgi:hypothetical protein